MANCGQMVKYSAVVTMESLYEITITLSLSHGTIADPYDLPKFIHGTNLATRAAT